MVQRRTRVWIVVLTKKSVKASFNRCFWFTCARRLHLAHSPPAFPLAVKQVALIPLRSNSELFFTCSQTNCEGIGVTDTPLKNPLVTKVTIKKVISSPEVCVRARITLQFRLDYDSLRSVSNQPAPSPLSPAQSPQRRRCERCA